METNNTKNGESDFESKRINVGKIEQICNSGFEDYLLTNDSIKVKGRSVSIENVKKLLFEIDFSNDLITRIYNKERVKIKFEAQYELFEKMGLNDVANIFVKTSFAFGYLRMDDDSSLHFEIDLVSFNG